MIPALNIVTTTEVNNIDKLSYIFLPERFGDFITYIPIMMMIDNIPIIFLFIIHIPFIYIIKDSKSK